MAIYKLKIKPKFFDQIINYKKTFELRYNDRGYKEGDILHLEEYENEKYTGRKVAVEVVYILNDFDGFGLKSGWVVMSIKGPIMP